MRKYNIAAMLFALLESDDDPDIWADIMRDCEEGDLPYLVRIKAAITNAINQILERGN